MYIGKSINLQQRVASYFRQDLADVEPHVGQLITSVRGCAWWQTRTELLALLLEDVLIKQHLPPLNTRQREFEENRYLELTADAFPSCRIVEHATDFGTREVFGPLKDRHFAATLQDVLHKTLGIRTCHEPQPVGRCLDHDIGRCAGPCRGALDPGEYEGLVSEARAFLRGDAEGMLDRLANARDEAATAQRYEEAAHLRDAIDICCRFADRQRFARRFEGGDLTIRSSEDGLEYSFTRGALVAPLTVIVARGQSAQAVMSGRGSFRPDTAGRRAVSALRRSQSADRRFIADRARIVGSWLRSQGEECAEWSCAAEAVVSQSDDQSQ
jgi:excinuclease UvrABC nuclease subunit